jgi:hypothetical protein
LLCHGIEISAMIASLSSISGILVLWHPPSWCTLRFTTCYVVLLSTAHNCIRAATFSDALLPNGSCGDYTM